ncbi:thioredoxin fold domain-containing protein, partial [candidate division KSB1 bacterium]|nr:thioredoxin fold domain-containing protein [candidate division KSB1 bacterium]
RNALFYLIGIAIAFSLLGLLSALAGKQWGFLFTSPWFVVAVSLIILSMSASLFGAFEITVPSRLLTRVGGGKRGSLGALTMGLTVGVVIAPCAAGLIIGLVGLVAKMGLVAKGTLLFFFMGLGLGSPYLILGTFSGLLSKLPQSGMWMVWVRKLFGLVLIGVALYFLTPLIERVTEPFSFLLGFLVLFGGLLLGFLDQHSGYTRSFKRGRAVLGALLLVFGGVTVSNSLQFNPVSSKIESAIDWNYPDSDIIGPLLSAGKPAFIDFYADWCAPCKEMDQKTFRDSTVIELSRQITMIKIDCTHLDARTRALMEAYRVGGMPTLVFIDRQGREILNMREIGYVGPQAMADKFARLLQ